MKCLITCNMIKVKKLPATFFTSDIYVVITDDWEEVNKKFNTNIKSSYGSVAFEFDEPYHKAYLAFNTKHYKVEYMVHECVHVVNWVLQNAGVKLDPDNDETQAYFTSWLFTEVNKITSVHISSK